jgi:hypothetical protein
MPALYDGKGFVIYTGETIAHMDTQVLNWQEVKKVFE